MTHKLWNLRFNAQDLVLIFHNIFEICAESELTMRSQNFKFKRNEKKLVTWFNFVNFYEIEFFGFSLIRNDSEWCNLNWFIPFYSKALVQYNFNETVSLVLLYLKYSIYFSVQKIPNPFQTACYRRLWYSRMIKQDILSCPKVVLRQKSYLNVKKYFRKFWNDELKSNLVSAFWQKCRHKLDIKLVQENW